VDGGELRLEVFGLTVTELIVVIDAEGMDTVWINRGHNYDVCERSKRKRGWREEKG
jgi:hypothetical protein